MLAIGLASALAIYLIAEDQPETGAGYVLADGQSYVIPYGASRSYNRDLQRFGGKAAVLFDELNRWFAARWRGKTLGATIGWISVFTALVLVALARRAPPDDR